MMTMEAELRALRDELSNRSSLASNQSSQATFIKDKEDPTETNESIEKNDEKDKHLSLDKHKDQKPKDSQNDQPSST